jgi:hypothetical protein
MKDVPCTAKAERLMEAIRNEGGELAETVLRACLRWHDAEIARIERTLKIRRLRAGR